MIIFALLRCAFCGIKKKTLLLDTETQTPFCFDCKSKHAAAPPIIVNSGLYPTDDDLQFLKECGISL
jgi:hypothetical protein